MLSSRPVALNPDAQFYGARTPGRALKGRVENAIHPGAVTVNGKGKTAVSRTPFHPATLQPGKLFKDPSTSQPLKPIIVTTRAAARPLGDKTPFPNRVGQLFQTPLPHSSKFPKLSLLDPSALLHPSGTPDTVLRPSSTRKHVRVPRSASKSFETPLNSGNHWDVSDVSIVLQDTEVVAQEAAIEHDYDDIEYMAPNTLDLPYQPPFDFEIPDYKVVGKTLLDLAHSYPYDDSPPEEITFTGDEFVLPTWDVMVLPEFEDTDDPFRQVKAVVKPAQSASIKPLLGPTRSVLPKTTVVPRTAGLVRTMPSVGPATTTLKAKPPGRLSRPGTSSSVAPKLTAPAATSRYSRIRNPVTSTTPTVGTRNIGAVPRLASKTGTTPSAAPSAKVANAMVPGRPVISTANPKIAVRRPMTSASVYKGPDVQTKGRANPAPRVVTSRVTLGSTTAKEVVGGDDVLVLREGDLAGVEADFRFDI